MVGGGWQGYHQQHPLRSMFYLTTNLPSLLAYASQADVEDEELLLHSLGVGRSQTRRKQRQPGWTLWSQPADMRGAFVSHCVAVIRCARASSRACSPPSASGRTPPPSSRYPPYPHHDG